MPTLTYATGFEHGTALVAGAGNGLAITLGGTGTISVTSAASCGSHSAFGLRLTATPTLFKAAELFSVAGQVCVGSVKWRATDLPTTNRMGLFYLPVGTGFMFLGYEPDTNKLYAGVQDAGGVRVTQPAASTVNLNQWYRIDFKFLTNGVTWSTDWAIDGIAQTQASDGGNVATNMTTFNLQCQDDDQGLDTHGASWDFDDLVLSATSGDYPIGEVQIIGITADQNAAAAHQSITTTEWQYGTISGATFTSTGNFTGNNETDSRSRLNGLFTTKGIRMNAGAAGQAGNARWPVADPVADPGTTAYAVSLVTASQEASAGVNNATFRTLVGASTTNHFSADPGWGTTFNYLRSIMTQAPGAVAWTTANVQGINFEADSTDTAPAIHLGGFFYEVVYPPDPFPFLVTARR